MLAARAKRAQIEHEHAYDSCTAIFVQRDEELFSQAVSMVSHTGNMGDLGFCAGHTPLATRLSPVGSGDSSGGSGRSVIIQALLEISEHGQGACRHGYPCCATIDEAVAVEAKKAVRRP